MPFKKGQSGNPKGRPKGACAIGLDQLKEAIHIAEEVHKKPFFVHCVNLAYAGDGAMCQAIMRKLVPDLKHLEGEVKLEAVNMIREVIRELSKKPDGS